jgi:hypothetical protein
MCGFLHLKMFFLRTKSFRARHRMCNTKPWNPQKRALPGLELMVPNLENLCHAVHERNPAPVDRWLIPLFIGIQHVLTIHDGAGFLPPTVCALSPKCWRLSPKVFPTPTCRCIRVFTTSKGCITINCGSLTKLLGNMDWMIYKYKWTYKYIMYNLLLLVLLLSFVYSGKWRYLNSFLDRLFCVGSLNCQYDLNINQELSDWIYILYIYMILYDMIIYESHLFYIYFKDIITVNMGISYWIIFQQNWV